MNDTHDLVKSVKDKVMEEMQISIHKIYGSLQARITELETEVCNLQEKLQEIYI